MGEVPQKLGIASKIDFDEIISEFLKMLLLQTLKVANDYENEKLNAPQGMDNEDIEESIIRGVRIFDSVLKPYHDDEYKAATKEFKNNFDDALKRLGELMCLLDRLYMLFARDWQGVIDENDDGDVYGTDEAPQEIPTEQQVPADDLEQASPTG